MRIKILPAYKTNGLLSLIHIVILAVGVVFYFKDVDPWSAVLLLGLNPLMLILRHVRFERDEYASR